MIAMQIQNITTEALQGLGFKPTQLQVDNKPVDYYTLSLGNGLSIEYSNHGGAAFELVHDCLPVPLPVKSEAHLTRIINAIKSEDLPC